MTRQASLDQTRAAVRANGRKTQSELIDAAQRLFAQEGIGGVSMRQIIRAANQHNRGAIQYHFSTKDGLIAEIFHQGRVYMERQLEEGLGELPDDAGIEDVVRTWVETLATSVREGSDFIPFLARLRADHELFSTLAQLERGPDRVYVGLQTRLRDALKMDRDSFTLRFDLAMTLLINTLSDFKQGAVVPLSAPPSLDSLMSTLVTVIVAMLRAPASSGRGGSTRR